MKPIYKPSGRAGEYAEWAINIYTGCPHRCFYCYAPSVLRRTKEEFHTHVEPRKNIIEDTKKQLERENIKGRLINLCFLCDPYPSGYDTTATREIIKLIKASGNHVQILTKSEETRDLDLLDGNDWFGVTITGGNEKHCATEGGRVSAIFRAYKAGTKTWISYEPVIDAEKVLKYLWLTFVDKVKIGKLNYHSSDINWAQFGNEAENICKRRGLDYYIKDDLRKEMGR